MFLTTVQQKRVSFFFLGFLGLGRRSFLGGGGSLGREGAGVLGNVLMAIASAVRISRDRKTLCLGLFIVNEKK